MKVFKGQSGGAISVTEKMIDFAEAIAEELHLPEPDYNNYKEVAAFIATNKDAYYQRRYDNGEI